MIGRLLCRLGRHAQMRRCRCGALYGAVCPIVSCSRRCGLPGSILNRPEARAAYWGSRPVS